MKREIFTDSAIVEKIKSTLNEFLKKDGVTLPKRGILTGQAVATVYLNIIGFDKHKEKTDTKNIINDVDVFLYVKKAKRRDGFISKKIERVDYIQDYGRFLGSYEEKKYAVVKTINFKSLNVTFVKEKKEKQVSPLSLISSFDINSTQIAINLETNELIMTNHFKKFMETGELKIVDINTPSHTAVRFAKKAREFGFYANFEREYSKLSIGFNSSVKNFTQKYFQNYLKHKDIIDKYFDLKVHKPNLEWAESTGFVYKFDEWYELVPLFDTFENFIVFHQNVGNHTSGSIIRTCDLFYDCNETKRNELVELYKSKDFKGSYWHEEIYYFMEKFYKKGVVPQNFKSIIKVIKEHKKMAAVYYSFDSFDELIGFHKNLAQLIREKGLSVIGILENTNSEIPSSYEGLKSLYKQEIGNYSAELIEKSIKEFTYAHWKFKEINTPMELDSEGNIMRHCVGGYTTSVKNGYSKIISLIPVGNVEQRYTIELYMCGDNKFFIAQCMAKFNRSIKEEFWLDLFAKEIKKHSKLNVLTLDEYKEFRANKIPEITIDDDDFEIPF